MTEQVIVTQTEIVELPTTLVELVEVVSSVELIEVAAQGPPGAQGPQGPQGPQGGQGLQGVPGPAGADGVGSDRHHTHTQAVPSDTWTITHNLGKYPSVSVVDSSGGEVEGEVSHASPNQLTVVFSAGFSGSAYLN